jgi:hypothetical protein
MKSRPVYKINNEISADIVNREIEILRRMPDLTFEDMSVNPEKLTPREVQELIRHNTKNVQVHQEWLTLISRILPEEVDDKIRLLRDLHQRRLDENITIITALQSGTLN